MIDSIIKQIPKNASWYDIIEISGTSSPVSFRNNRLHSLFEKQNHGYGIRVNIDGRTGFSYTNDKNRVNEAVERASSFAPYGEEENFSLPKNAASTFEPYDDRIKNFDSADEIIKAEEAIDIIKSKFPHANIDMGSSQGTGFQRLINSNGLDASYRSSSYSASLSATLITDDDIKIDVWEGKASLYPFSYTDLTEKIITSIENALIIKKIPGGKIPVIIPPRAFTRLLGILLSGFNAKSVWKGISPFAGKLGEKMFNESLTITDTPLIADSPYSYPFDDEGTAASEKMLIKNGTINKFVTDLKHAEKLNIPAEGNATRGYSSLPSPSFSSIVVNPGNTPQNEILKTFKKAVIAESFIGLGQSNTLTGEFSANLDMAYLVENGEITGRVKDCMITDNLFSLLAGDFVLSSETETVGSSILPWLLFPEVSFTA